MDGLHLFLNLLRSLARPPHLAQLKHVLQDVVLDVTVRVFRGPQTVGHALDRVHDRAHEVVGGVGVELGARAVVRRGVPAVQHRVPQRAVVGGHVNLGAQAVLHHGRVAFHQAFEQRQAFFGGLVAVLGLDAVAPLLAHLLHRGVVHEGMAVAQEGARVVLQEGGIRKRWCTRERSEICKHLGQESERVHRHCTKKARIDVGEKGIRCGTGEGALPTHPSLRSRIAFYVSLAHLAGYKVVGGVGDGVGLHVQARQVAQDVGLELFLLLGGVGVVEPQQHLPLVALRVVLVQQHRLSVRVKHEPKRRRPQERRTDKSHGRNEQTARKASEERRPKARV